MSSFQSVSSVDVLGSRVLSHDQKAILAEAGLHTPLRWFTDNLQDPQFDEELEPASKRRKLTNKQHVRQPPTSSAQDEIPIVRISIKLRLSEDVPMDADKTPDSRVEIPVLLHAVGYQDDILNLRVAQRIHRSPLLELQTSSVEPASLSLMQHFVQPQRPRPAGRCQFHLVRTIKDNKRSFDLNISVTWADGVSAFPDGAPVGGTRFYADLALFRSRFSGVQPDPTENKEAWSPRDFYESVYVPDKTADVPKLPDVLQTQLFPFQRRAVAWMMARENTDAPAIDMFETAEDIDNQPIYYNMLQAVITRTLPQASALRGGILAEEMGLGKTVELMALIAARPSQPTSRRTTYDLESSAAIRPSKATLIITPNTILRQWMSELSQHAPQLKVYEYTGIGGSGRNVALEEETFLDALANDYDVVLTTYQTLSRELHYAVAPPERNLRHARKYERPRSFLIQLQWWRICLDEAQMVESGVTAAAQVACRLPRVNSWAVSGTPVKKNVEDLFGLLLFLGMEPFSSKPKLWAYLINSHRSLFKKIFGTIALRHTKSQIREDIQLPPQKRVVMTLPFTAVESQHYTTLFQEMCHDIGVESDGSPSEGGWDPDDPRTVERMRTWLIRLRQTCLHPQVGGKNRRRLGKGLGPLRTVAEVLDVMIEQNETTTRAEERLHIAALLQRAHILGFARDDRYRAKKAQALYSDAMTKCKLIVSEARARLAAAVAAGDDAEPGSDDEDSSSESTPLLGRLRNSLRAALNLVHACIYFTATATYQIKANEEITTPDSEEFKALEQQEIELYEEAKVVRREILKDAAAKSERLMAKIKTLHSTDTMVKLPTLEDLEDMGGIESRRIVTNSYPLFDTIRDIGPYIIAWREKIVEILSKSLVDEDDTGNEITGDEYEESTKQQDALYVYLDALKALHADLNRCITGETAPLIDHEAQTLIRTAKQWLDPEIPDELKQQPHSPELLLELFKIRQGFRSKLDQVGSIRGLIAEARHIGEPATLGTRAAVESELAQKMLKSLQDIMRAYTKALTGLNGELELYVSTQNQRLDFYRQLQEVSDDVAPYKEELDEQLDTAALQQALDTEERCVTILSQLKTKHRFLIHLKQESGHDDNARICVICQGTFENGVLTVCGHQYCKECITHWWREHRTCPVCKRRLALVDFHSITYRPKEVKIQEENQVHPDPSEVSAETTPSRPGSIYSEVDEKLRDQIKSFDLPSSYGTKIDTLSRHLLWIREHDPGAKSIVFSQYKEFLDVLHAAFTEFKIGHRRLGRKGAVEDFRQNPAVDCLLLDAKTDSSGLTLVNATHVFVCEPLVQTAVELQAIARVHRIGQLRPTTVWMYLVNDTVEESIYEISVARRMAHVQAREVSKAFQKSRSSTPGPLAEQAIDAANSEELQNAPLTRLLTGTKGGGELVEKGDLWQCLFGKARKAVPVVDEDFQAQIDRNLRAQAAESRAL
ncbi:hypothetical protein AMS68_005571 [Peltaster fructicola]|uniref:RING-type domain-containing protein n=1 Tax=Peltaster fructicola TaxID=286661 RepID=A0A6H0XZ73_9PEZI|nr:hypothetical protein AMS68_005571 [Peltaster fructicola]